MVSNQLFKVWRWCSHGSNLLTQLTLRRCNTSRGTKVRHSHVVCDFSREYTSMTRVYRSGPSTFISDFVIPADANILEPTPGKLKSILESRLTAAKRYYQDIGWREHQSEEERESGSKYRTPPELCGLSLSQIRNISVVAHVDHGKTTLTDAILRWAELLPKEAVVGTFTDRLQVEKKRGITIKAQTCSVLLRRKTGSPTSNEEEYFLINLVDTPGHADFQYEVSRSLHATEGVLLLVDAAQGVEAQTLAHFYAVLEREAEIIPVLTKMDAVTSDEKVAKTLTEMENTMSILQEEVLLTSAKKKQGLEALFQAILDRVPPPSGRVGYSDWSQLPIMHLESPQRKAAERALVPLRALLFDCWTAQSGGMAAVPSAVRSGETESTPVREDGVYCLVRVMDGTVTPGTSAAFYHSGGKPKIEEVGIIHPCLQRLPALTAGMVGYVLVKDIPMDKIRVGDTLYTLPTPRYFTQSGHKKMGGTGYLESVAHEVVAVPGFQCTHPVVFAAIFPDDGNLITALRESVEVLRHNDPSVTLEEVKCQALGSGLQLGFLGLLHLQVFIERMLEEFGLPVLVTPPQVQYMYVSPGENTSDTTKHKPLTVENWRWPHEGVGSYLEPVVHATVVTPRDHFDSINQAAISTFRAVQEDMRGMDDGRMVVRYLMPLGDLARGFYAAVKSLSHGYASLDYDKPQYVEASIVKVDVIINKARISALSFICPQHEAVEKARRVLGSLKSNLQRSSVDLPLIAELGSKTIARETIKAYKKDVTAKIHAGDISRKQKKWNDQKKGKKRMAKRSVGTVVLNQDVLSAAMGASMFNS